MNVTIKDIARLAQVSHTTVSRSLNDSPLIKAGTKEKIKRIAKELGYTPNFRAKSLVLDRSYNIGLFFSSLQHGISAGFFYETVRGVNSMIKEGYHMAVRGIDDYENFGSINRKSFDGVIVVSQNPEDGAFLRHLAETAIPYVVLNRKVDGLKGVNLLSDDCQGAYEAVGHLIRLGHKRIAVIEGNGGIPTGEERRAGCMKAMADNGVEWDPGCLVQGSCDWSGGYTAMRKLLKLRPRPTAVFCHNDDLAAGAMKAIAEWRLNVPDDISVVGFDNQVFSPYLTPSLTTVKRPVEEISSKGAYLLLDGMERKRIASGTVYFQTELIERDSVATPYAD